MDSFFFFFFLHICIFCYLQLQIFWVLFYEYYCILSNLTLQIEREKKKYVKDLVKQLNNQYRVIFWENFVIFQNYIYTTKSKTNLMVQSSRYTNQLISGMFVSLFVVRLFVPLKKGNTGEGLQILVYTQHSWPHFLWHVKERFIMVISEDPWHSCLVVEMSLLF